MSSDNDQDLAICTACGTQFDEIAKTTCRICDDPRQFVPPEGQSFTTLRKMKEKGEYKNIFTSLEGDQRVCFIRTEPKFAIGQRAVLIKTAHGNVLWDCITYIDDQTIQQINSRGGLTAIVISHPHFYTTSLLWSRIFNCPIYTSIEDNEWLSRPESSSAGHRFITTATPEIVPGMTTIKTGGHFEGSLVLHWDRKLFIADSFVTVPSAHSPPSSRIPNRTTSYAFMYSIPNMIPLSPSSIAVIIDAIRPFDFDSTHGGFPGMDVSSAVPGEVKGRVLESAEIVLRAQGLGRGWYP